MTEKSPHPDGTAGLEPLRERVSAFGRSDADALEVEPALREDRRNLVAALRGLGPANAEAKFAARLAEPYRLLADCGLRELPRDANDEAIALALERELGAMASPHPGTLLAATLLCHGYELPLPAALDGIPEWLLPDYARFLLRQPRIFHEPGDAERFRLHLAGTVTILHRYLLRRPSAAPAAALSKLFVNEARFMQLYFNDANLRDVFRQRAEILEHWLLSRKAPLAQPYALRPEGAPARRLRVGVLAAEVGAHTETYFTLAHIERLPARAAA